MAIEKQLRRSIAVLGASLIPCRRRRRRCRRRCRRPLPCARMSQQAGVVVDAMNCFVFFRQLLLL